MGVQVWQVLQYQIVLPVLEAKLFYLTSLEKTNYTGTIAEWVSISFGDISSSNPIYISENFYINFLY